MRRYLSDITFIDEGNPDTVQASGAATHVSSSYLKQLTLEAGADQLEEAAHAERRHREHRRHAADAVRARLLLTNHCLSLTVCPR